MSLGDLHNPKAAADLIANFRKRFSTKVCMAPQTDHSGGIVSAHTLSSQAVLRKLSVDGHVYAPSHSGHFSPDAHPIEIRRLGLRDVSVFNGFCAKHDAELFSCIENEPFCFRREQCFMLAYRATARECYLKRKQSESIPTPDEIRAIHGIDEQLTYSEYTLIHQAASLRGAEEVEGLKAKLDGYLVKNAWDRLVTYAVLFPQTPNVAASFAFQPFHDMNGIQLQDYVDLSAEMSLLIVNLLPLEQGGAAIFSWPDSSNSAPRRFFDSVVNSDNLTSSVIHAVLDHSENFAFAPVWYEAQSEETKAYLFSRIVLLEGGLAYSNQGRPDSSAPFLDDWGKGNVCQY